MHSILLQHKTYGLMQRTSKPTKVPLPWCNHKQLTDNIIGGLSLVLLYHEADVTGVMGPILHLRPPSRALASLECTRSQNRQRQQRIMT
jgi:hypothetical protein